MLNNIQIKAAKPKDKRYQLSDGGGLFLEIDPNGSKYWKIRTQVNGKRIAKSIGKYPDILLSRARELRDEVKQQIKKQVATNSKVAQSFYDIAIEWHKKQSNTWSDKHQRNVIQCERQCKNDPLTAI